MDAEDQTMLENSPSLANFDAGLSYDRVRRVDNIIDAGVEWTEEVASAFAEGLSIYHTDQSPVSAHRCELIRSFVEARSGQALTLQQVQDRLLRDDSQTTSVLPWVPFQRKDLSRSRDRLEGIHEDVGEPMDMDAMDVSEPSTAYTWGSSEPIEPTSTYPTASLPPRQSSSSMSRRRLASNIPALHCQVNIPISQSFPSAVSSEGFIPSEPQTPIPQTPLEQMLHTPLEPPETPRHTVRPEERSKLTASQWSTGLPSPLAAYYSPTFQSEMALSSANSSRSSSPVPGRPPMLRLHSKTRPVLCLPRRLSYSHATRMPPSPLSASGTERFFNPSPIARDGALSSPLTTCTFPPGRRMDELHELESPFSTPVLGANAYFG
ncbi:hypothetical protein JAAARDRAFT_33132 [Jaapia argillacea MUCL 33604]|uniref:Uncharacterized protein n=1 Tax=Jaapia argillacea MUCL 33604 TaxID=933084 RepID=A0A067Q7T7_9AGAM|nr:hypothetical protein JAAARDRAFT_33132 [Jaapia argillacea MUCL 33604]